MGKAERSAAGGPPPSSLEAEAALLSAVLLDREALEETVGRVAPEDFYHGAHRKIFAAVLALAEEGRPVDLVTVAERLKRQRALKAAGGAAYLARLLEAVPAAVNAAGHAAIIRDKALLRTLMEKAWAIYKRCQDEAHGPREVIDFAERSLMEIVRRDAAGELLPVGALLKGSLERLAARRKNPGLPSGVPTGFAELNRLTNGFQGSDLVILAARPSVGKTALALNFARHAAVAEGRTVGIFSLEMSREQLATRLLCAESRVSAERFRDGFVSERDWAAVQRAAETLAAAPIFIDDASHNTAMSIRAKSRRLKLEHGLDLLVIDYLQLMREPQGAVRRDLEVAEISRALKALARELDIPVIALSQLNREVERRDDKRPQLADLRESGALEQDADLVLLIHREGAFRRGPATRTADSAELIVAKQRNGPTGSLYLSFLKAFSRFESYAAAK